MNDRSSFPSPSLRAGLLFQGSLIPIAFLLAWLAGISLPEAFWLSWNDVGLGLIGTLPLLVLFVLLLNIDAPWAQEIEARIREVIVPLFREQPVFGIISVSLLAGIGEELLFRGVLQEWIAQQYDPLTGLVAASILFGAAHWITSAYALLATGMGLLLGALYMWTGNLLAPILAHALYDMLALGYYFARHRPATVVEEKEAER